MDEFFERLKQRKHVQWALAYIAAAFALIQVIDIIAQRFGWPEHMVRFIIVALAIGFFVTLVLAWYHGERGAQRVSGTELLLLALLLTIGGAVAWRLAPSAAEQPASADNAAAPKSTSVGDAPVSDKSIAVLPLFNLGGDAKDDYLGDGISEEILTGLSKLHGLKVIGRASSFQFRGRDVDAAKVGHALGVHSLLTGTVQRAGDNLRITVELVDTGTGSQMWSQHYDRAFSNLFALEDDISGAVSNALAVQLGAAGGQPIVHKGTNDPHAHDLYLRARQFSYSSDEAALNQAVELFNQTIADDSSYAEAWAGLAYTYAFLADAYRAPIDVLPPMKGAAEKAVALDPDMAEAHAYLGYILLAYEHDFVGGRRELDGAVALNPGSADAHFFRGIEPLWRQRPAEALADFDAAEKIDPRNPFDPFAGMWAAVANADQPLAIRKAKRTLEIDPGFSYFTDPLEYAYGSFGRWQDCIDRYDALPASAKIAPDYKAAVCMAHLGNRAGAQAILNRLEAAARKGYVDHANLAEVYASLGDRDGAIAALEQAYRDRSQPLLLAWFVPEFKPLHDDPRYKALMEKLYRPAAT